MAITIRDVARRAQVSVATVSRALTTPDLVRAETRSRVLAAATELGYRPNRAARGLITGRTGNIGIVVPDLGDPVFTAVLKAAQARAAQADYAVFVAGGDEDPATEVKLVHAMAKQVDGVLVCAPASTDEQVAEAAGATSLVLLDRDLPGVPAALLDGAGGAEQVVDHLVALGHRRVAVLDGPRASWSNRQRRRGLAAARARHGVDLVDLGPFAPSYEGGTRAADLALAGDVTAIVAYDDIMASGVLARLRDRGVPVPGEMSVTGFGDLPYAELCSPPLTTVAVPLAAAGRTAVAMLLAGFDAQDADVPRVVLPTRLVVRSTTAPPPGPVRPRRDQP
ncbi:LacI family DNA-binding transcriptional regulator [Actinosynnema sp. NPDC047251]|uniref:Transcriptional regulator, LacI family n=1 Tax=Saccharothrix espanaensis (strain ATCC 51144 / DSM 44229 / JCM 9112 / NBRC 15066 / NRRL 15764) TaxID=1179773 RepID=K0KAA3_SACES|nr:LacI family DNA-binding transcriptional regulator [Saccharothrix espanaensis]CCH33739.1 Transcriptional regulator, LacI family [Saccharothrix espanaensis DSM 44229]